MSRTFHNRTHCRVHTETYKLHQNNLIENTIFDPNALRICKCYLQFNDFLNVVLLWNDIEPSFGKLILMLPMNF